MTIWNLGSINADLVYRVPHLPGPGETLGARSLSRGLGGKGANMSVAAARAAARVVHLGAVGREGAWMVERLLEYGVDTRWIATRAGDSGHAVICVDDAGENLIVIHPGANREIQDAEVAAALDTAAPGDWFLSQNETNGQVAGAEAARARGLRVAHAAAPFEPDAARAILPLVDLLVLNAVEAAQLEAATGARIDALGVADVVVTRGGDGCRWHHGDASPVDVPALAVDPVDTTGAGDTFTGFLIAGLDRGLPMRQALALATQAAALMVTRAGAADVIPDLKEIEESRLGS
ncbi:Ribokinase [Roseivivax jejudonensis]|uniref:Ribokinase n=1 Tax=Roseivivax jejudonensis TaxID=1529041 RepID=A0A1X6ZM24_9RHOB|nr:PfkB family carbohydrate kinase [Roseivivax jejudonensis]SLN55726.1 Ribokinase [Roseivivax jejudonensis]